MAEYPLPKFSFLVEWGGARLGFTEVTGLERSVEVIDYREGSMKSFSKLRMPGMEALGNVTLKRGTFQGDGDFYAWFNTVQMNTAERRDVIVKLLNENLEPTMVWRLANCFAVKYQATELKADGLQTVRFGRTLALIDPDNAEPRDHACNRGRAGIREPGLKGEMIAHLRIARIASHRGDLDRQIVGNGGI